MYNQGTQPEIRGPAGLWRVLRQVVFVGDPHARDVEQILDHLALDVHVQLRVGVKAAKAMVKVKMRLQGQGQNEAARLNVKMMQHGQGQNEAARVKIKMRLQSRMSK